MANESNYRARLSTSNLEQIIGNGSLAKKKLPRFDSPVHIRVISYRIRNTDPDGISVKAVLDGIVAAGVLTDDSSKQVASITFENRKAKDEKTIIEIEEAA
ncbi:hypothetical protein [uncultured Methylophaga sp.]|uniref:hypothetical protein n=1 Tax=uncultured Methylophaga sp. TaxID=285271 RepID=UPI0030F9F685